MYNLVHNTHSSPAMCGFLVSLQARQQDMEGSRCGYQEMKGQWGITLLI